ncbi:hypothetical protein BX070DRAFT_227673 [Coemansia spiralis]|nr:hypothetical protein BX070DRAFT_227673 [Coemansia spiralis]
MLINGSVPVRSGRIEALLSDSTIAQSKSISIPRTGLSFSLTTRMLFAEMSLWRIPQLSLMALWHTIASFSTMISSAAESTSRRRCPIGVIAWRACRQNGVSFCCSALSMPMISRVLSITALASLVPHDPEPDGWHTHPPARI